MFDRVTPEPSLKLPLEGWKMVSDEWGIYYTAEHVSGDIALYMRTKR